MSISSATPDPDLSVHGAPTTTARVSTLVLLGASGDLANRLLMPALGKLLDADGSVINGSIRLIEPASMPDARYKSAFEAGRRALIRCSPYTDLPREKYAQWRNIEVVFNPEGMVSW